MKLFWICPQMKISEHVFQHVPANETVLDMPTNENLRNCFSACARKLNCSGYAHKLKSPNTFSRMCQQIKLFWICPQMKISEHVFQDVPANETVLDMPTN
jgi:hypothetical protein